MFRFIFISFFAIMFIVSNAQTKYTEISNPSRLISKLEEKTKKTNSLESVFVQEKYLEVLSEKIISNGQFYFKKNNLLRWEYTEPFSYLIVINNGKFYIKDDEKVNEYDTKSNSLFKEINDIIIGSVQGTLFRDKTKFKTKYYENDNFYKLVLSPQMKEMQESLNKINIYFSKKTLSVTKIKMIELSGDYTSIKFRNRKSNVKISDEKFSIN